ncbi:four helix bundle protein [Nonlabens sp. Ci31]|jgi:four helix bundle protein|uniref:four helix bundle protein n=1 Tax=Nonlabens sp. Ci31 TaxID=2608253 RepID=UPI001463ACD4|nr:four helix bundle protein [Nonlabens sp. Ci31]QJP33091.1 four helix bundle protein [Nonlabens sp. Ci31]
MKFDIETRLIQFSVDIIKVADHSMNNSYTANHLCKQLIRSSTAAALNYGEAQSAESHKDFLHKMKIALKELRESMVNLKIQKGAALIKNSTDVDRLIDENNQLISIFVASIKTSKTKNS